MVFLLASSALIQIKIVYNIVNIQFCVDIDTKILNIYSNRY
jgi:hypothetical protein